MPRALRFAWAAPASRALLPQVAPTRSRPGPSQRAPAEVTALIEGIFTTFLTNAAETGRVAFAWARTL